MIRKIFYIGLFILAMTMNNIFALQSWALQHGVGQVNMIVSTQNQAAKKNFLAGLALMESFEFDEARQYFVLAQKNDPKFAMAYWGEAMSQVMFLWFYVNYDQANKAYQRMINKADLVHLTALEKQLINSSRILFTAKGRNKQPFDQQSSIYQYRLAMKKVHNLFPHNPDVAYLYAHAILATRCGINDYAANQKAGNVLLAIYDNNKNHPGLNHLILHSFENVPQSYQAKSAAERYAKIAPGAIHGLHMPSHYYFYQGNWQQLVTLNQYAWKQSKQRQKDMNTNDDALEYHGFLWLIYAYLQLGDVHSASDAILEMNSKQETSKRNKYLATAIGHFLLHTQGVKNKQKLIDFIHCDPKLLNTEIKAGYEFSLAIKNGYRDKDKISHAAHLIKHELVPKLNQEAPTVRDEVMIMLKQLQALEHYAKGDSEAALNALHDVGVQEDNSYREHGVPMIVKPSHELRGDLLMAEHRFGEALIEYKTELLHNPYRRLSVEGLLLAAQKTGNKIDEQYALEMIKYRLTQS